MDAEELAVLKAKYSSAQLRSSGVAESHVPFSSKITEIEADPVKTDAYNALDKYVVCMMCQGSGIRRVPYNHRFLEENCEQCSGEGIATRAAIESSLTQSSHVAAPATADEATFDVIIVGGGLAGLRVASSVIGRSPQLRVALLEARQDYGGRTCAEKVLDIDGNVLGVASVGGTWIGQKHEMMLQLARDVDLEVEEQYYPRSNASFSRLISLLSYSLKPLTDAETDQMNAFIAVLEAIVSAVDIFNIAKLPNATVYDALSIKEFVSSQVKAMAVRYEITTFFESILSCDVSECSFLYAVWLIASSGGLEALGDNTPTSNQMYVLQNEAGPAEICSRLAERLKDAGVAFFRATATSVDYSRNDKIILRTDYFDMTCKRCVFAMNPALAFTTIQFEPKLPSEKKLSHNVLRGHVIKIYLCYDYPFWGDGVADLCDDRGVNTDNSDTAETTVAKETEMTEIVDNDNHLSINEIFPAKNIFYSKKIGGYHSIVALITGKTCESVMGKSADERKELILQQLQDMYDNVDKNVINKPIAYLEKNWCADALSGGCFSNGYRSFINVQSALQAPLDKRVFFASSETSVEFCGYMEGALAAGDRVADMILQSLT